MNTIFKEKNETMHIGHNIKRIREIQGIKQEAFGQLCRNKYSQQRISDFENMVALDEPLLEELAAALGVTPEFVKSFKDENVIYNIQHSHTFNDHSTNSSQHMQPTFNNDGSDKLVALLEKFIEEDRVKTQSIAALSQAVLDLTNEVKKLKEGK
ncbi:helix-turn-helix transcriptional regulator [Parapusillimonas sp. SGNA-6]|uniref:helix-turn-helix domain-containing protein n=1 Tax=Parapedobacter sp. SGR-10 TaxID=2710879 RepID=UPI0013D54878|nr:helix-turn-helix transcriptional regulator [Parapedobacter sp. SGR-10]NGF56990.1 helix-turn-helix transcriptional regulator [Parapedobacter sp. SGR-10]NGM89223.1 helix-turn-helix transcriptional regulator [Parapusillimonas sp. SGNA-6]